MVKYYICEFVSYLDGEEDFTVCVKKNIFNKMKKCLDKDNRIQGTHIKIKDYGNNITEHHNLYNYNHKLTKYECGNIDKNIVDFINSKMIVNCFLKIIDNIINGKSPDIQIDEKNNSDSEDYPNYGCGSDDEMIY